MHDNTIQVTATSSTGTTTVSFTAYCGVQSGLALWLAADSGITQDGSGNISAWADQGADHNDVSQTTSGQEPTFLSSGVNGKPSVSFNGSQYLAANDAATLKPSTITMVVVAQYASSSNGYGSFISKTTSGDQDDGYGMGLLSGPVGGWVNDYVDGAAQGSVPYGQYEAMAFTYDQNNVTFRLNGQTLATEPFTDVMNNPDGVPLLIGTTDTGLNYPLTGSISEVLIYNRALSSTELQQVEVYLADKYGLYNPNATWPLAYDSDVQAQITANQWSKAQADAYVAFIASSPPVPPQGLLVWLKANVGITTDDSGNVQQWVDQSPSGHILGVSSQAGAPALVTDVGGHPTLEFDGGQALYAPDYIPANNDLTMIIVGSASNNWSYSMAAMIGQPTADGSTRSYVYNYGTDQFDLNNSGAAGGSSSAVGEEVIHTITYGRDSGAVNFYLRGAYNGYGNATASDIGGGLAVGNSSNFEVPYFGDISEILIYDRVLSNTERTQAEVAMADKYGIYHPDATWPMAYGTDIQSLISENAWSKAQADAYVASLGTTVSAPSLSPAPGAYTSSQTVVVTSATQDATIYYTTDGTIPTTSSASIANGGHLIVSSSERLKLMAADGSASNSPVTTAIYRIGTSGSLVAGDSFTMANKPNGTVWTWGDNSRGQQGDNQVANPAMIPQQVPGLSGVTAVAAAGDHALAVTGDGSIWAWGADDASQGGDGGTSDLLAGGDNHRASADGGDFGPRAKRRGNRCQRQCLELGIHSG